MIPAFDDDGMLPPGIHECTFDELAERFGTGSPEREVEIKELRDFFDWAQQAGIERVVVNGSFVTAKRAPNDVDVVILPGVDDSGVETLVVDMELRFPFLQIIVAADEEDLESWATSDFGTDRHGHPKGVVEVTL